MVKFLSLICILLALSSAQIALSSPLLQQTQVLPPNLPNISSQIERIYLQDQNVPQTQTQTKSLDDTVGKINLLAPAVVQAYFIDEKKFQDNSYENEFEIYFNTTANRVYFAKAGKLNDRVSIMVLFLNNISKLNFSCTLLTIGFKDECQNRLLRKV